MRIFLTRLVKFEIAHFFCRGAFLKALSENRLNYVQDSGIKYRFSEEKIKQIMESAWWDKNSEEF